MLSRDRESGAVHVRETPEGMAAEQAGLLVGDRIKMVDGVLIDELPAPEIRALLRGEVGSKVVLTVIRGERVLHVELKRERLETGGSLPPRHERIE